MNQIDRNIIAARTRFAASREADRVLEYAQVQMNQALRQTMITESNRRVINNMSIED